MNEDLLSQSNQKYSRMINDIIYVFDFINPYEISNRNIKYCMHVDEKNNNKEKK